jgi:Flp pilus assembly protein TadG
MKFIFKKLFLSNQGTSLIELALIMPVLLLLVVGALDLGSAFVRKMEISNATKAGIQYAMVRKPLQGDLTNIKAAVTASLGTSITPSTVTDVVLYCECSGVQQVCTAACASATMSAFVTVSISENYTTPFFNYSWFMASFPITETSTIQLN